MLCKVMFLTYLQSVLYGSHKIKGIVFERTDEMCMGQPHGKFNRAKDGAAMERVFFLEFYVFVLGRWGL
jgi:hypothetical protein